MLVAALFSIVCVTQAKDPLTPKKYHLQEINFISHYKDSKDPKASDVYLTLEWRQKSGTHPKQTTDHTIKAGKMHLIKSPGIGYYLQDISAIPSVLMSTYVVNLYTGAATQGALTTHHKPGNNKYFEISAGEIPKGSKANSVQVVGYKDKDAYDLANGITPAVSKKAAKQAITQRNQVGPNGVIMNENNYNNQAPIAVRAGYENPSVAARTAVGPNYNPAVNNNRPYNNATPVATAANYNNNNAPAAKKENKKDRKEAKRNAASSAAANHSAAVSDAKKDKKNKKDKKQAQASAARSDVNSAAANHSAAASAKKDKKKNK